MKHEKLQITDLTHYTPKQEEAFQAALKHRYVLYGGAMAGGKSYWLRWALVRLLVRWAKYGHRNVEVGLFCETYSALEDRQLSKVGKEFPPWLGTYTSHHALHGRAFILADEYGGGIIKFRNLDDPSKYQSAEFAAIAVDELTKNTEDVFDDLRNRLRWPGITDIRFMAATNPGGIGHSWVKKRWLDRQFDENETEPDQFHYVRALAQDNPHIDKSYLKQLESLPADKRKAYLEGDWDIFKGQYFTEWRRNIHVCEPWTIPDDWRRFCALDYGYNAPSALGWFAIDPTGQLYLYRELYQNELTYTQLAEAYVSMTGVNETIEYLVADPAFWAKKGERDDALSGAEVFERRVRELTMNAQTKRHRCPMLVRGVNDRVIGWREVREYLRPFQFEDELTAKLQVFSTCTEFIRTFPSLIHDENNPEDVDSDGEDHAGDMLRYAVMSRPKPSKTADERAEYFFNKRMKEKAKKREHGPLFVTNR